MPGALRWVEVTPSPFPHEAEGLRIVRELLPQTSPYRAWSNVEFRDGQGKWHEVDLIVLGQRRLHLVELKYYSGTLRGDDLRWRRDGHRAEDSPLKLARRKAQRLASKLRDELIRWAEETGTRIDDVRRVVPFVQESVFLHHPGLRCLLPTASQVDLFGLDGNEQSSGLPGISTRLLEPPTTSDAVGANREQILAMLMSRIGLVQRRQREVGSWVIDDEPLSEGDGWQDWSATHRHINTDRARIRVRVVPPGAETQEVTRVRKIVEHEYRVMSRLTHDGVLKPRDLVDDDLGIGLVYSYDESYQRLDLWQTDRPQGVPLADQLSLLRQVAEAVGYAHGHRVVHRGLTPHAIWVKGQPDGGLRVLVGDWQTAGSATGEDLTGISTAGVTALAAAELVHNRLGVVLQPAAVDLDRRQAEAFQAPEGVWNTGADRVRLDVFSLGAVAYFVLAGRPPAADRTGLRERIQRDGGLDLAADLPQISSAMRALVLEATRPSVSERLSDVGAFLERLATVERSGTSPDEVADPLDATAGAVLDDRWQLERRLGAGSTAVGLLVSDLTIGTGADARRVLKVGINDAAMARLDAEARVLAALKHRRIVRLVDGPIQLGTRRALVLEPAGDQTLGDVLTGRQRLSLDLLERWGTDLLDALVALDKAGVDHRDIKPANLGVREGRRDRTKHLILFDFSLTQAGATAVGAGTPPYLDPFLDTPGRGRYDSAAERYSAAVVLFEMATGRPPVYGDGLSDPASIPDEATVEASLFDPSLAQRLVPFFRRGLARRVADRHHTAADMFGEWKALFAPSEVTVPDDAESLATSAEISTPLAKAGLSARALSAIEPFGVSTVGDLVAIDPVRLNRMSGASEPTRREVKQRAKQWRDRFGLEVTGRGRQPARRSSLAGSALTPAAAADLLIAAISRGRAETKRHAAALLLGIEDGVDAFATQGELGAALSVTRARAAQLVGEMQEAWAADDAGCRLLTELADVATDALQARGGVATVGELAAAVLASMAPGESVDVDQARVAAGLLRVALDRTDALDRADAGGEPLVKRRRSGRLVALATAPELLDLAEALASRADELVEQARTAAEPVVAPGRATAGLRAVSGGRADGRHQLSDSRLVQLGAAMSQIGALSGRGELHDRDLAPVEAIRLALAGVTGAQPITAQELRDRVRARFPALPGLPDRPRLDVLVSEAGLNLRYDDQHRAFRALTVASDTTGLESRVRTSVAVPGTPLSLSGGQLDRRLTESARSRSFLALGVDAQRHDRAAATLVERHGALVLDVTGMLIDALRSQSEGKIGWDDVVAADARPAGTREALGLSRLVELALPSIDRTIEQAEGEGPLLLVEASPLARYDKLSMLSRWTDLAAPRPRAVWLLVSQLSGNSGPVVDGRPLPLAAPGQFVRLDDEWLAPAALASA